MITDMPGAAGTGSAMMVESVQETMATAVICGIRMTRHLREDGKKAPTVTVMLLRRGGGVAVAMEMAEAVSAAAAIMARMPRRRDGKITVFAAAKAAITMGVTRRLHPGDETACH